MAEASILSSKPERKDINKYREHDEWYSLGTELEIDDEDLDDLEDKWSPQEITKDVWCVVGEGGNPTYRKLLEALVKIDKKDITHSICQCKIR